MRKIFAYLTLFLSFLFLVFVVHAQEFRDDYDVVYRINQNGPNIDTTVKFAIKITNLRSDLIVKKFTLAFPKSFEISDLKASDDKGPLEPNVTIDSSATKIELEFNDPEVGRDAVNTFFLDFRQENLFKINGNVWEVILPTIEGEHEGDYQVQIFLPQDSSKKISIAKPIPTSVDGNVIFWKNPPTRTIYAVFGDVQLYDLDLTYHLENDKLYRVYTDVAFPPDMLYQKVVVDSIDPKPTEVFLDEDGNFLGRYYLNPRQSKTIRFKGTAALYTQSRPEVKLFNQRQLQSQQKYLLTQSSYWTVDQVSKYRDLKTPVDIHNYLVTNFSYDYERVNKDIDRLGAKVALQSPDRAVCVEFSDSFVALAREKGIYAREIEGYGFSNDPQLRPLSLVTDILHSWPEYYDKQNQEWVSIDPTWENTSGIDYFSSFDLDHIAFAIHGKEADYPVPAGSYKQEDSRDLKIEATALEPKENAKLTLEKVVIGNVLDTQQPTEGKITVHNDGNVFQYNIPIKLKTEGITATPSELKIDAIAPLQSKTITFNYRSALDSRTGQGRLTVELAGKTVHNQQISIRPYYYDWTVILAVLLLTFCTMFFIVRFYRRRRKNAKKA